MKIFVFALMLIILMPFVFGEVECSKVSVVNFNYDNGVITYKDRVIKCGYAPDRVIQPKGGYKAEVVSMNDEVLHSFVFEIPLDVNFDMSDPLVKSLSGGMMILNETDFALIFPYYDEAKSITIYNPRGYEVLPIPLIEEKFIQKKSNLWWLLLIVLLLISGYMVYRHFRKTQW